MSHTTDLLNLRITKQNNTYRVHVDLHSTNTLPYSFDSHGGFPTFHHALQSAISIAHAYSTPS